MKHENLIIDGMLSGTGLRDAIKGGYISPVSIGISLELQKVIADWLSRYEEAHFHQYQDEEVIKNLDREGIEIAKKVRRELPDRQVRYFSDALMKEINLEFR